MTWSCVFVVIHIHIGYHNSLHEFRDMMLNSLCYYAIQIPTTQTLNENDNCSSFSVQNDEDWCIPKCLNIRWFFYPATLLIFRYTSHQLNRQPEARANNRVRNGFLRVNPCILSVLWKDQYMDIMEYLWSSAIKRILRAFVTVPFNALASVRCEWDFRFLSSIS